MKTMLKFSMVFFLFFLNFSAKAGMLIEPYVGFLSLSHSGNLSSSSTTLAVASKKANGLAGGARLGYGIGPISFAMDYMKSGLDEDGSGYSSELTNIGAAVIVGIPFIRGWAEYVLSSKYKFKDTANSLNGNEEGSGFKLGVGYTLLPFVSLNLEYLMLKYDEASYSSYNGSNRETKGYMLSLSIPL